MIGPDRWMNTYFGKDVKTNGSVFILEVRRGLPVNRVVKEGSEKHRVSVGRGVKLFQTPLFGRRGHREEKR